MTFREFFAALWGDEPFPWQEAVADAALRGEWPQIGLPTAAGKTALIDVAVWALAMRAPRAVRRIFFVVDRRVIVDDAARRSAEIAAKLLSAAPNTALGRLADSLRDLGGGSIPLETATLRGGIPREDSWAKSPLQPIVICSTVDQVGSALLFRAYGASEYAWPIRAGLAANDSLILLDEAHTSRAFAQTLDVIARYRGWSADWKPPFTVVQMSATPGVGETLREREADLEHPVLKRRWEASKQARLVAVDPKDEDFTALVEMLAKEARRLRDGGAKVIGVIANRVRTARRVYEALARDQECEAVLLIGRARPYDRDRIWEKWNEQIRLGRAQQPGKSIYVVATQCIEVGANLDFDGLATEIASMDALEQRFGRLDRDGRSSPTYAAIVAQKDQIAAKYVDKLYGGAMPATWKWIERRAVKQKKGKAREQVVEMGVRALREALRDTGGEERAALLKPSGDAPLLLPAHLDLLNQTSPEPEISPEVSVFLHGPETGPADVQVVWRADLGDEDPDSWAEIVAMCPPAAGEMLPVPLFAVRRWLAAEAAADVADLEGEPGETGRFSGGMQAVLVWKGVGDEGTAAVRELDKIRPGMTIVVPSRRGGCDEWGWNPESTERVYDVGDAVKCAMERPMLRLHPELARQWDYEKPAAELRSAEEPQVKEAFGATWVKQATERMAERKPKWIRHAQKNEWAAAVGRTAWDQNDVRGSYGEETGLAEHMTNCARVAAMLARELPDVLRRTIEQAAQTHDLGKADPRFQAWLRGGNPVQSDRLIAKSSRNGQNWAAIERARKLAGYPKGGRHELLSVAMLAATGPETNVDWDLLLHLVSSHHGRCRPFAPVVADDDPVAVEHKGITVSSAHGLERVGSGVSERFWTLTRKYGWHGLAYLEALLRLADHRQSEAEQSTARRAANV